MSRAYAGHGSAHGECGVVRRATTFQLTRIRGAVHSGGPKRHALFEVSGDVESGRALVQGDGVEATAETPCYC